MSLKALGEKNPNVSIDIEAIDMIQRLDVTTYNQDIIILSGEDF